MQLQDVPGGGPRNVNATVRLDPPSAADDAKWLTTTAWQGGGLVVDRLERVREGVYRTNAPVPVHGSWKAEFRLHAGRSLVGVPIYLPDDPAIPAKALPARASFERPFVRDKDILQREAKTGTGGLTLLGYGIVLAITLAIVALNAWALVRLATVVERFPNTGHYPFEEDPERFVSALRNFIAMNEPSNYDEDEIRRRLLAGAPA